MYCKQLDSLLHCNCTKIFCTYGTYSSSGHKESNSQSNENNAHNNEEDKHMPHHPDWPASRNFLLQPFVTQTMKNTINAKAMHMESYQLLANLQMQLLCAKQPTALVWLVFYYVLGFMQSNQVQKINKKTPTHCTLTEENF